MPHYKLTYFPVRGLAEVSRYIFAQADVPYENVEVKMEDWPTLKASEFQSGLSYHCANNIHICIVAEMPMGQLPVLDVDGQRDQSLSGERVW